MGSDASRPSVAAQARRLPLAGCARWLEGAAKAAPRACGSSAMRRRDTVTCDTHRTADLIGRVRAVEALRHIDADTRLVLNRWHVMQYLSVVSVPDRPKICVSAERSRECRCPVRAERPCWK